jgi:aryl-alcohol dehydrogenase-like predicted oxidoreductase
MKYRRLGKTELQVSAIGVGTWQFGGEWAHEYTQAEVDAILDQAEACGINLIDTAECYGDHVSEALIGDYLSRRNRSRWIVATKFGHQYHGFLERTWHLSPPEVQRQLEASLRALRIDAVDLYQFHSGTDPQFQQPALWSMLQECKQAGKIRHLGVSISSKSGPLQAQEASQAGASVIQVVYNRLERRAEQDFFPHAQQQDLGVLARVPLASGFLSGKYRESDTFSKGDMRSTLERSKIREWISETAKLKERLPSGTNLSAWALAWCLRHPAVSSVIPGCKDPQQVAANAAAAELEGADEALPL